MGGIRIEYFSAITGAQIGFPGISRWELDRLRRQEYTKYLEFIKRRALEQDDSTDPVIEPAPMPKSDMPPPHIDFPDDLPPVPQPLPPADIKPIVYKSYEWLKIKTDEKLNNKSPREEIKRAVLEVARFISFSTNYADGLATGDDSWAMQGMREVWVGIKPKDVEARLTEDTKRKVEVLRDYAFNRGEMVCAGYATVLWQALQEKFPNLRISYITNNEHAWLRVTETAIDIEPTLNFYYVNIDDKSDQPDLIKKYEENLFSREDERHSRNIFEDKAPSDVQLYIYSGVLDAMTRDTGFWKSRRDTRYKMANDN